MPRDFTIACGEWVLECTASGLPEIYDELKAHAALVEESALDQRDLCCLTVRRGAWPFLVIALGCEPAAAGFSPGALLAGEVLFVGYGERALAFRLSPAARLWSAPAPGGFRFWERHGEVALLGAGRGLAAWSGDGSALWSVAAAPGFSHRVEGEVLALSDGRRFLLREGPR